MKRRINLSRPRRTIYHDDTFYGYGRSGKRTRASAAGNRFGVVDPHPIIVHTKLEYNAMPTRVKYIYIYTSCT